jgi:hypothetical protein
MKRRIEPFEAPRIGSRAELINGTWYWIDDQPEPDSDKCPSCGIPYVDHSGLIGTCRKVQELTADRDRLHVLLSCAHGALADCGLPVPGMDQDIAPVIRKLTEERDRYKRLAGELAQSLYSAAMTSHYRGIGEFCHNDFDHCTNSGCVGFNLLINKARQEGVIE